MAAWALPTASVSKGRAEVTWCITSNPLPARTQTCCAELVPTTTKKLPSLLGEYSGDSQSQNSDLGPEGQKHPLAILFLNLSPILQMGWLRK